MTENLGRIFSWLSHAPSFYEPEPAPIPQDVNGMWTTSILHQQQKARVERMSESEPSAVEGYTVREIEAMDKAAARTRLQTIIRGLESALEQERANLTLLDRPIESIQKEIEVRDLLSGGEALDRVAEDYGIGRHPAAPGVVITQEGFQCDPQNPMPVDFSHLYRTEIKKLWVYYNGRKAYVTHIGVWPVHRWIDSNLMEMGNGQYSIPHHLLESCHYIRLNVDGHIESTTLDRVADYDRVVRLNVELHYSDHPHWAY